MNLGLTYSQIKDKAAKSACELIASVVSAGYHIQHNTNDTHKTITATGPISERKRTVPIGAWTDIAFLATNYTATGTTWVVTAAEQVTLKYMLIGTTLFVSFYILTSTVNGATANLFLTLPLNASLTSTTYGMCLYNDNGTLGTATIVGATGTTSPVLKFTKDFLASVNWTNSAGMTLAGSFMCDVTGTI